MRVRMMACVYLLHQEEVLLLYKESSRAFTKPLWVAPGGHFEEGELTDPRTCMLRELREETGLCEDDLEDVALRYITVRRKGDELRQQYIYWARAKERYDVPACDEGTFRWVPLHETDALPLSMTNAACMAHYRQTGRRTQQLYLAVAQLCEGKPAMQIQPLEGTSTAYD